MRASAIDRASVGEDGSDFVGEIAPRFQAEIGGPLTGKIAGQKLFEHIRPEQAAFNADRREQSHIYRPEQHTTRRGGCLFVVSTGLVPVEQ